MKFFFLWLLCASSYAQDLRIITVDEAPASYIDTQGNTSGYVVDIVKALKQALKEQTHIEFAPEARLLNIVDRNANVIFFSFSRTSFREDKYHWIGLVMKKTWSIYALKNTSLVINSLDDVKTISLIGTVRGDVREEWLVNRNFLNLDSVTYHQQNVKRLFMKRISAIAYEKQGLAHTSKLLDIKMDLFENLYDINQSDVYIAMSRKGTSIALLKKWQHAFEALRENGTLHNIASKWQEKILADLEIATEVKNNILVF